MAIPQGSRRQRLLPVLLVAAASLLLLAVLNPHLLLVANTPTGGDMGAHVLGPAYLRDVLLPQGRVLGWSDSWFAGFPAFYFYFPLPSLVIVLLDVFLPYGVAFKIVTVLGLVGLPPATASMIRAFGASRQMAAVAAAGAAAFALMESFTIYGGNIASTMAGEFSFSWSFSLGMVYLGLLARSIDDRSKVRWAALVLGLTALSHILTTIVLALASIPIVFQRRAWKPSLRVGAWGFAIAGFWAVPVIARIGLTADMGWNPLSRWEEIFPIEVWFVLPLALIGLPLFLRRHPRSLSIAVATVIPLIYYPLPHLLPIVIPALGEERWKLWNGRLLPYWYFGVNLFAAIAIGYGAAWLARRLPERTSAWWVRGLGVAAAAGLGWLVVFRDAPVSAGVGLVVAGVAAAAASVLSGPNRVSTRNVMAALAAAVIAIGAIAGTNFVYKWARWNYSGYEGKETWAEYDGLMQTVGGLDPGRIQWEQDSTDGTGLNKYGTPMAPMLYPYWTEWTHPSMEGLFFESSLTTPFMFLTSNEMSLNGSTPVSGLDYHGFDFDRGVPHMELFGVRYYVTYSPDAATKADARDDLQKVAESPVPPVFDIDTPSPVVPVSNLPVVADADSVTDDPVTTPVAVDGPEEWERVSQADAVPPRATGAQPSDVADVTITADTITFRTDAVGVPHYVDVPYTPHWGMAGAEGPYEAAGEGMYIVPTAEDVVVEFIPVFSIYELTDVQLVEALPRELAVYEEPTEVTVGSEEATDFDQFALDWFGRIDLLDRPVVVDGPDEWPRVSDVENLSLLESDPAPAGAVRDVEFGDHRISFTTDAIGVPHLVKMSYFPNWSADGAEGPYRATPSLMVVVPTQADVVLEFGATWAEIVGNLLTVVGVGALAFVWWSGRRRGQHSTNPEQSPDRPRHPAYQ